MLRDGRGPAPTRSRRCSRAPSLRHALAEGRPRPVPARRAQLQHAAHARIRTRAAATAAAAPRALRTCLLDAPDVRAGGVRARAGGEPLHDRLGSVELPLARRWDGGPDPAARRWAAHHRRRLPPARAPDHAAGVPPRADRRCHGDHGGGARARARTLARRPATRPVRLDPQAGAADRDARPVRLRPCARTGDGGAIRAGAGLLGARVRGADASRPGSPYRSMVRARPGSTR